MVRGEEYRSRRNESKTEHQWCIQDDKKNNWEKRNATDGIKDKDGKILTDDEQVLNRGKRRIPRTCTVNLKPIG